MVSATSARPSGAREGGPAKMTSSILPPRSDFAPCSPITQESASTTLDLPEPFGPTTQVMPGSRRSVVADANDLKPRRVRDFRYTNPLLPRNDPAERPSLEGYRPGRPGAGKRAATGEPGSLACRVCRLRPPGRVRAVAGADFGVWPSRMPVSRCWG